MNTIPSEVFTNSYCIFIPKKQLFIYKNYIVKNQLFKNGVGILEKANNKKICAIVIPSHEEYKQIENNLFDLNEGKDGFWGQFGLGYKGEKWKAI